MPPIASAPATNKKNRSPDLNRRKGIVRQTVFLPSKLVFCNRTWVRIQKPVVTYDIVTCDKKAVCPDLFATLTNVFDDEILILFADNC
jgi:hypothetical protein